MCREDMAPKRTAAEKMKADLEKAERAAAEAAKRREAMVKKIADAEEAKVLLSSPIVRSAPQSGGVSCLCRRSKPRAGNRGSSDLCIANDNPNGR